MASPLLAAPLRTPRHFWIVLLAYAGTNAIVYAILGIQSGGDTERYLEGAQLLVNGSSLEARHVPYAGFIVLLAALIKIFSTPASLIPFQLALGLVSCAALYSLGNRLGGRMAGLVAALLYAANPDIQIWNFYLLTDSVYISLLLGVLWLAAYWIERAPRWGLLAVALVGLPLATVRLDGWACTPAAVLTLCAARLESAKERLGLTVGLALIVGLMLMSSSFTRDVISRFRQLDPIADGTVVFTSEQWRLSMPQTPASSGQGNGMSDAYAFRHPVAVATLVSARVLAELAHVRPHYSARHNAFIVMWLLPAYVFTVIGCARTEDKTLRTFVIMLAFGHLSMVAVMWADWDGRFLLHFLPTLFPFAGAGVSNLALTRHE